VGPARPTESLESSELMARRTCIAGEGARVT
jgi:hypothetical protein